MIQHLSSQLLKLSSQDRRVFVDALEKLDTKIIPASYADQNYSHQVLGERRISSIPFMVKKQMNHQDSGAEKLQQLTSNPVPLLPTPSLWFHLSWGNLIITTMMMVILKFTIQIFQLSKTLNHFQIQTLL